MYKNYYYYDNKYSMHEQSLIIIIYRTQIIPADNKPTDISMPIIALAKLRCMYVPEMITCFIVDGRFHV